MERLYSFCCWDCWRALRALVRPLVRAPEDLKDLLVHQLISGVTAGGMDIYGMEDDA